MIVAKLRFSNFLFGIQSIYRFLARYLLKRHMKLRHMSDMKVRPEPSGTYDKFALIIIILYQCGSSSNSILL